jgi:hypothetical protein
MLEAPHNDAIYYRLCVAVKDEIDAALTGDSSSRPMLAPGSDEEV